MSRIRYGTKYQEGLTGAAISATIRQDIKAAVSAGELPRAKYSVRLRSYSGGRSIDIVVSDVPFALFDERYLRHELETPKHVYAHYPVGERRSKELRALLTQLEAIGNAYNFDGSEIESDYFHVNFYLSVGVDWRFEAAQKERELARVDEVLKRETLEARARKVRANLEREPTPAENPILLSMQRRQAESSTRRLGIPRVSEESARDPGGLAPLLVGAATVSYTHLTLPTSDLV